MTLHTALKLIIALGLFGSTTLAMAPALSGELQPEAAHPGGDMIGKTGRIRFFLVGKPDQIERDGKLECVKLGHAERTYKVKLRTSPLPPANWTAIDFDDGAWPKAPSPISTNKYRTYSLLCARVKFLVGSPQRAALSLSMSYRGGTVIYLNGKEVKRTHMPEGKITLETPAQSYPQEAWVDPGGFVLRNAWGDASKYKDRFAKRIRKLHGLELPASSLRKGLNVLAIELHRPLTDVLFYDKKPRKYSKNRYCNWSTLRLSSIKLEAAAGAPVAGPASVPSGFRVWNHQTSQRVTSVDVADPSEPLRPVVIQGARNGWFSGQVVAGCPTPIKSLKATLGEFTGPGKIHASNVQIRYGLADGPPAVRRGAPTYDGLEEIAPASIAASKERPAICPIWITIHVPANAKPGKYKATLSISAAGCTTVKTPIHLTIADWKLPDATESNAYYWLVQSPEALAKQYSVPMWSEQHWKHTARSFELMRQVSTRIVYIPMFREAHQGNEHTMIRWIKKGAGWDHDFSIFEKYIDTALKNLRRIDVVALQCWPRTSGGTYFGGGKQAPGKPIKFTSKAADGTLRAEDGPVWGTPESRKFWKAVLGGAIARLQKRGLGKAAMVGICHDVVPSKATVLDLKAAAPQARWVIHCHPKRWSVHREPAGYLANVWGLPPAPFPEDKRIYGWKEKRYWTTFPRYGSGIIGTMRVSSPFAQYRCSLEAAACAGLKGFGWVGADCWPVIKDKRGRRHYLLDFYEYDKRTNLGISSSVTYMLRPGKNGPIASARHDLARMSLQENEARVVLEKALTDPASRAKLGADLSKRAQGILDQRLRAILWGISNWNLMLCSDWEKLTGELYATAAEVRKRLGE